MPRLPLAALCAASLLLAPLAARADIDPGNWELTITASVAGMGAMPPQTHMQCLRAEDARDPSRVFGPTGNSGCRFENQRDTGSEFIFDVACTGQVPVTGSGRVRYSRDTMSAQMQLSGDANGQKFTTSSSVSGRRLGPCN